MMSMKSLVLCFGIVALSLQSVCCIDENTTEKFKQLFELVLADCGPKFGVTKELLVAALDKHDISSINSCFIACAFKYFGFINDKGMFNKDAAIAQVKKNFSGDDASGFEKVNEKCISVNDATVSDGEEGCERAKLLVECYYENKDLLKL